MTKTHKEIKYSNKNYFYGFKLVLLTFIVSLVTFMEVLDSTIINVSIPHIAGSLGATVTQGTWTISLYALASAIVIPLTAWVSKVFGTIRVFTISIGLFIIMSVLCGFSKSITELVIFRFFQGFFSGPMVPLSQTILLIAYPPEKRGVAMSFFVMTVIVAPILGPILGGYITDKFSWPWIFYINLPVGLITIVSIIFLFKGIKHSSTTKVSIDYIGIILLFIGVGSLQLMLDNGNNFDWFNSKLIIITTILALIGITLFIIWELTDKQPAVDLKLFANYNYTIGTLIMCLGMFCFFGSIIIFPLWLQVVKGYTSLWSGLATAPIGILPLILSPIIGIFMSKLNLRILVSVGFTIFAFTMFWFGTFNIDTPYQDLILPRIIQGIGISFFFLPLNQIALSSIPKERLVSASSLFNFSRAITTSIATAIIIYLWQHSSIKNYAFLIEHVSNSNYPTQEYLNSLHSIGFDNLTSYAYIESLVNSQATTISTEYIFNTMGVIFLLLIIIVWFTKPPFTKDTNILH